jgi:transposase
VDELTAHVTALDGEITRRVDPQAATIALLDTIPGIDRRTADAIVAEVGPDVARFPSADHLRSSGDRRGLAQGQAGEHA